jgi:hypothetical protein
MNSNKLIRLIHRWLSAAMTVGMTINLVAVVLHRYTNTLGLLAVVPLVLLFLTGEYMYVAHYAAKWRSARRVSRTMASAA